LVKQTDILIPVSYFSSRHQQGHAGSKTLHQQNSPVLNWGCRLLQVDLFNGYKADVVVVVVVVDILVHETKTVCYLLAYSVCVVDADIPDRFHQAVQTIWHNRCRSSQTI